jgi:hypothetical protein
VQFKEGKGVVDDVEYEIEYYESTIPVFEYDIQSTLKKLPIEMSVGAGTDHSKGILSLDFSLIGKRLT